MKIYIYLSALLIGLISICSASPIQKIESPDAPAFGAYPQALSIDLENTKNIVFVTGQVPINPKTGKMVDENIQLATNQTLDNIEAILKSAGSDWEHVVRMDVFLLHFDRDWDGMNEEYAKRFSKGVFPVRYSVGVTMDNDTLVEMTCIAIVPKVKE